MTPLLVPHTHILHYFNLMVPHLQRALNNNRYTEWDLPGLYASLTRSDSYLYVDSYEEPKNALVGRYTRYSGDLAFYIQFMGGEGGHDWAQAMKALREIVARWGATELTCHPRAGWAKHLKIKEVARLCVIEE